MRTIIIGTENGQEIVVKGGLSLGQLETLNGEIREDEACPWRGFLREAHKTYMVRKAREAGLGDGIVDYDDVSRAIGLRDNEIRNSDLCIWHGGYNEMAAETARSVWDRSARAVGWAAAVLNNESYPALNAFIRQSLRYRPEAANSNASYTWISWYTLVRATHCWNPGKLERSLWAAREAFNGKFPSANNRVSWHVLGRALAIVGVRSPGKAAIVARAIQLGWDFCIAAYYADIRDFLIKTLVALRRGEWDKSDDVEVLLTGESVRKGAIVAREYYHPERRELGWLFTHPIEGSFHSRHLDLKRAWKEALDAFRARRKQRLAEERVTKLLEGEYSFCPLIMLKDSYDAGNCVQGTEAWMRRVGLNGRKLAPLSEVYRLAKETGEKLAINAVMLAAERAAKEAGVPI